MTGELTTMHGVAGVRERVGDEAKLDRRAAEPMHEQHAQPPAAKVLAAVRDLPVIGLVMLLRDFPAHAWLVGSVFARAHRAITPGTGPQLPIAVLSQFWGRDFGGPK